MAPWRPSAGRGEAIGLDGSVDCGVVPDIDPYAVLSVPRSATRLEIASAYRRLAKRWHPDAIGPLAPDQARSMARINEAWRILSDAARRASWDDAHPLRVPATVGGPSVAPRRPPPADLAPHSLHDSGWFAAAVVAVGGIVVAGVMIVLNQSMAGPPTILDEPAVTFASDGLTLQHPDSWRVADGATPSTHPSNRVVAHLTTFEIAPEQACTAFDEPCAVTGDAIPAGEASIIITAWEEGTPPEPNPVRNLPAGREADRMIGGEPAAFEMVERFDGGVIAWWQLSPPGFPDRWFEVRADLSGQQLEIEDLLYQVDTVLATIRFDS